MNKTLTLGLTLGAVALSLAAWKATQTATPAASSNRAANISANATALPATAAPYDPQEATNTVAFWQNRVRNDPQGAVGFSNLAAAYLALGRESGDIAHAIRAENAARHALKILPSYGEARYRLARSLLTQHRFAESLKLVNDAAPADEQAQRLRTDVFIELGEYAAARAALKLAPTKPDDPNGNALEARLLELYGNPKAAQQRLHLATYQALTNIYDSPESLSWYHVREARGLANMGQIAPAEKLLHRALSIFPRDYRAMFALASLAANTHRWRDAVQWSQKAMAIIPEPATIALLATAYQALGQQREAQQNLRLVETVNRLSRAKGVIYDRQRALFYADHDRNLDEALKLAQGEMKQRHDIYSYDTLAWALYKKQLFAPALAAARQALKLNTQDAMLWYHAGLIEATNGNRVQAQIDLQKALQINPQFHPFGPARARALLAKLAAPTTSRKITMARDVKP